MQFYKQLLFHSTAIAAALITYSANCFGADELRGPKPLDGIKVEAVETYQNPKTQQLNFGLALLPLDPYYNGFGIDLGYTRYFSKTYSWNIVDANYIFSVKKDLTSQLADQHQVDPTTIEHINFIFSSNLQYVNAYGKFVFLKDYLHYFRSSWIIGPAFVVSSERSNIGANIGWRFETFINPDFSWTFELRDVYAPGDIANNLAFGLGTAYGF